MRLALALLGLAAVTFAPRIAEACSCSGGAPVVSPADGATNVPTNARVIALYDYDEPLVEVRAVGTQDVLQLTFEAHQARSGSGSWKIAGAVPFLPNTEYEVTVTPSFSLPTRTTFTTGSVVDVTPSNFAGLESIALETMTYPVTDADGRGCYSSCIETGGTDHVSRIRLGHAAPPSDVALVVSSCCERRTVR